MENLNKTYRGDDVDRVTADQAVDLLVAAGLPVEVNGASHIDLMLDGHVAVEIKTSQTPTTPSQRAADRGRAGGSRLLYVVPHMTKSLRAAADSERFAVVALDEGLILIDGEEFRPISSRPLTPALPRSSRRTPWGRFAVMRALCRTSEPRTQARLAEETGVTQAAVSHALEKLSQYVVKDSRGWVASNIRDLATQFLGQYPGPGGIGANWYSLDPVSGQADRVLSLESDNGAILSGDVGADRIAPWRVPRKATVYATAGADLAKSGFAQSTADKATLELRVPADPTIWPTANAFAHGHRPWVADPLIVSHDILRSGGADSAEAIDHLLTEIERQWRAS